MPPFLFTLVLYHGFLYDTCSLGIINIIPNPWFVNKKPSQRKIILFLTRGKMRWYTSVIKGGCYEERRSDREVYEVGDGLQQGY